MWCDDDKIKPYFIEAGKNLTYGNLRRQMSDSLEDKPFPELPEELQKHTFWEFGSKEEHFKYRNAVMQTYIHGNFPVFEGFNHMQYQIQRLISFFLHSADKYPNVGNEWTYPYHFSSLYIKAE